MVTKTLDVSSLWEVQEHVLVLLDKDTEIILTKGGIPVAKLVPLTDPLPAKGDRTPDLYSGLWMSDDFDDLLPDQYWRTREG